MTTDADSLTTDDLVFLRRPLHGFLSMAGGPLPPQPRRTRLAARYWDLDDPARAADLAAILADDQVRLVIHPETVRRYRY